MTPSGRPPARLALGIGNPGARYEGTRHNAGFDVLDLVARRLGATWTSTPDGDAAAEGEIAGCRFILLKPGTYVNLSGTALRRRLADVGGDPGRVLVVCDDMALEPGVLRLRASGSPGGHNGLRSVIAELGTEAIPRLRVGIGSAPVGEWTSHVLGRFADDEIEVVNRAFARAADGVSEFLSGNDVHAIAATMNRSLPRGPAPGTEASEVRGTRRTELPPEGSEETPTPPEVIR